MKSFDKLKQALTQAKFEFELNYLNEIQEFCKSSPFKINNLILNIGRHNDEGDFVEDFYIASINDISLSHPYERDDSYESFIIYEQNKSFAVEENIKFVISLEKFLKENYSILDFNNNILSIKIDLSKFNLKYEL